MKEFKHSITLLKANLKDRKKALKLTKKLSKSRNTYFINESERIEVQVIDLQKAIALLERK